MLKIIFLDSSTIGDENLFNELKSLGDVRLYPYTSYRDVSTRIIDADIVLTNKVRITKEDIESSKKLKAIFITATGTDNIDLESAAHHGIIVKNVKGYAVETVAQHTFAMLLNLNNKICYYDSYVKDKSYSNNETFTHIGSGFNELFGKKIGIIGLGSIGKSVARIAKGFGLKVIYHSPTGVNSDLKYKHVSLEELLCTSDFVSIHSALNQFTHNLINFDKLQLMKPNSLLINMGRGSIVVESDLVKALNLNIIKGACIDVFEQEPIPHDHPYYSIINKSKILLSPHVAWSAIEARTKLMKTIFNYVDEFKKQQDSSKVHV